MLNEDREIEQGVYGCAVIALFAVLSIVVSIAVGVFFGAGFGLITYALFIVFLFVRSVRAFKKAGK